MDQTFDSRFELVVLEGGGAGGRRFLDRRRITLGRLDPGDEPEAGTLAFPDPTVSRVHAVLEWDPRIHRYVLEHRSRTNHSVVNGTQVVGSQVLQPGDRIKLGALVLQLQALAPKDSGSREAVASSVESGLYLVELAGPGAGTLHPLNYTSLLLCRPPEQPTTKPGVFVPGAGPVQASLAWQDGRFRVGPGPAGQPPGLLVSRPGMVLETTLAARGVPLEESCLLLCDQAVLGLAGLERAGELRAAILEGAEPGTIHPLLPGLRLGQDPAWEGGEEYVLRVLSGPHRGTRLWIRPENLEGPVTLGPADSHLFLGEKRAPRMDLLFTPRRIVMLNADESFSFTHNWETVTPGEEIHPVSGDRFTVGRTVVSFEHLPTQAILDRVSVFQADVELPLVRTVSAVGHNPQNELRIDDRRLGPTHGLLELREGRFFYRHKDTASKARVGERELAPGDEVEVAVGDVIHLLPDLEVRLAERVMVGRPGDHVLIGPTQEEIEAARAGEA